MMQFAGEYVTNAESAYLPEGVSVALRLFPTYVCSF